jgi:hypothetical protein
MGKKRRVENADLDQEGVDEDETTADGAKRRKREAELQRQVDEYTVQCLFLGLLFLLFSGVEQHFISDRIAVLRCSKHARRRRGSARKRCRRSQLGYGITRVIWGWPEG